jgi:hypothetical protein
MKDNATSRVMLQPTTLRDLRKTIVKMMPARSE